MSSGNKTGKALPPGVSPKNDSQLGRALEEFRTSQRIDGKGRLSQLVYLSRLAREKGLPLVPSECLTDGGGQIKGAGGNAIKRILVDYRITRKLSAEGGRTSRGSIGYLGRYIELLNDLDQKGLAETDQIEAWWVDRVKDWFNATPFSLRFDPAKNLRTTIRDLLAQAEVRQREAPGTMFVGAMLQHLVGAKLDMCVSDVTVEHHSYSTSDAQSGRAGDFLINNAAIHVTTAPSEALMGRCRENLHTGFLHPIVITISKQVPAAEALAESAGIADRIEIFDAEQFISANLLEFGSFLSTNRYLKVSELIATYNVVVTKVETDPSLKIT